MFVCNCNNCFNKGTPECNTCAVVNEGYCQINYIWDSDNNEDDNNYKKECITAWAERSNILHKEEQQQKMGMTIKK